MDIRDKEKAMKVIEEFEEYLRKSFFPNKILIKNILNEIVSIKKKREKLNKKIEIFRKEIDRINREAEILTKKCDYIIEDIKNKSNISDFN